MLWNAGAADRENPILDRPPGRGSVSSYADVVRRRDGGRHAEGESWGLEDLLARSQVPRTELLSGLRTGAGEADGCVERVRARRHETTRRDGRAPTGPVEIPIRWPIRLAQRR